MYIRKRICLVEGAENAHLIKIILTLEGAHLIIAEAF